MQVTKEGSGMRNKSDWIWTRVLIACVVVNTSITCVLLGLLIQIIRTIGSG